MDAVAKYEREAGVWERSVRKLGYADAYEDFLGDHVVPLGEVLDVGTGTGAFARAWLNAGGSGALTLLEPSAAMLSAAEANLKAMGATPVAIRGVLEDFSPPARFDVVLAAHVVEHCERLEDAFAMLRDLLKPGGRICMSISKPHWCNWLVWIRFRHRWFDEAAVVRAAESAGLRHTATHAFASGPPSRTSFGYVFARD